jgi:VanZ family protein
VRRLWLLYLILIFGLSSIPSDPRPKGAPIFSDKVAHFVLYAGLGWAFARLESRGGASRGRLLLAAVLLAATVGLADEFYQGFVPNRTRELADWAADLSGGTAGAVLALGRLPRNRDIERERRS